MGWAMDQINRFICYTNREPILKVTMSVYYQAVASRSQLRQNHAARLLTIGFSRSVGTDT